jgi:hypothetical protein
MVETAIPLRPAVPPATRVSDPTAPIRQRRHRAKKKAATVTSRAVTAPPVQAKKANETKATVTPPASKSTPPRAAARTVSRAGAALRHQHVAAAAVALLAGGLTFLSVHHLATGYAAVTHCADWEALVSAIGIDCGFILLELAQLVTVKDVTLRLVARWANPAIMVTLCGSAGLNAFAFMQGATEPLAVAAAAAMGCFLPGFIYVLTRVSAHLAHH